MIIEYHRPTTLQDALKLLARAEPVTVPLAGGTVLNRPSPVPVAAVDLQALGLDWYEQRGNFLRIGPALTLQALLGLSFLQPALHQAIRREAAHNLRQVATVAGALVSADGRSPFTAAMLALDALLELSALSAPEPEQISLGDLLPLRTERLPGRLITQVTIPLNVRLAVETVARTPADRPLVIAAAGLWPSGRTRVALGGFGPAPILALDGPEPDGVESAVRNAASSAGDEWASAEYRQDVAVTLALRCLEAVRAGE